jgi:hypothetical protein
MPQEIKDLVSIIPIKVVPFMRHFPVDPRTPDRFFVLSSLYEANLIVIRITF